jgi:CubicO group peptidase (beta-lactamase class C family)
MTLIRRLRTFGYFQRALRALISPLEGAMCWAIGTSGGERRPDHPMNPTRILLVASLFVSGVPLARSADDASARLPRSAPEEQGVSASAVLGFVEAAEQKVDALHSLMIVRHGHVVAEGWWSPYGAEEPHMLYSLSKSFTSTAVGFAVAEGKLSLDDTVLKFFPDQAPALPSKNLLAMRVRDLLRMSSGQRADDISGFPFTANVDLVKAFLELPVPDVPGTHFVYNTPGTYMLSAIVQKATGQTVLDYLRPRLFGPLGMGSPRWDASAQGISLGGIGLNIRTEDIARFGQLYLQKGRWQGRQLLPAAWIEEATSMQTANGSDPESDWNQGYGYQFWRCRHGFFRGDGAFGQFCIVMPQYDTVVALTSGTGDLQGVLNLVWEKIVPALAASALPADPESDGRLSAKLSGLTLRPQEGQAASPLAAKISGRRYVLPANPMGLQAVSLKATAEGGTVVTVTIGGSDQSLACGQGTWTKGSFAMGKEVVPVALSGAWTSDDTFSFISCRYRTPYITSWDLRFSGDRVIVESTDNVGLVRPEHSKLVGVAQP